MKRKIAEKMSQMKKNKKGFTLIELIVVIAIIGVLAALLVPSMIGYVDNAKIAKNDATARTIYTAAQAAYTTLNDETLSGTKTGPTKGDGDTSKFIDEVNKLIGEISGTYSIEIEANKGVKSVSYTIAGGTPTTGSSSITGHYPAK